MIKIILAGWALLLSASLIGWGALGFRLLTGCQKGIEQKGRLPYLLLAGVLFVTFQALVANFWMPLTQNAGLYTIPVGLSLLLWFCQRLAVSASECLSLGAAIVWVVFGLPFDSLFGDAGLYHLQFEQWIANSPLLWGLANIQSRFGFDSAWLIFVSATRVDLTPSLSPWMHALVADMMIRAFIFCWLLIGLSAALKDGDRFGQVFYGFGFVLLSVLLWRMREAGTDNPANLIAIGLWLIVYEAWQDRHALPNVEHGAAAIVAAALIVTSKLSILPLLLLVLPVLFAIRHEWKRLLPVAAVACVFVACWVVRNFILTGCLVYPAAITCVDVPWGLGAEMAKGEAMAVTTFARKHIGPAIMLQRSIESVTYFSLEWLMDWLKHFPSTYYFRVTSAAFVIGLFGWVAWGRKQRQISRASFVMTSALIALVAFVYWLVLGPDPRFAWSVFYVISVSCICWIWIGASLEKSSLSQFSVGYAVPMVVVMLGVLLGAINRNTIDPYKFSQHELISFDYRGVMFYTGVDGECGEQMPCVGSPNNHAALDKIFLANPESKIFFPEKN